MAETILEQAKRLVEWHDELLNFDFVPHVPKYGRSITGSFDVGGGFTAECHLSLCGDEVREQDKAAIQAFSNLCGNGVLTAPIIARALIETQEWLDAATKALKAVRDCPEDVPERYVAFVDSVVCEAITSIEQKGSERMQMIVWECQTCDTPFAVHVDMISAGDVRCPMCSSIDLRELGREEVHVPMEVDKG